MRKKIGMIALGCAKNRVDAEVLLGMLEKNGYEICSDLEACDVCIIHTCTFIGPAKEESIGAILDAAEYKTKGKLQKIIVTGCMAERYRGEIIENMPEVDACLGSKSFDKITEAIESDGVYEYYAPLDTPCPDGERVLTSTDYSVYVKIADGCSNHCTYCVIPSVRGEFQPRDFEDVLDEIRTLAFKGAKEINLIAQDTTKYPRLCELIKKTCEIPSVKWVRVLYCRPEGITDEFLELMAKEEKFCSYIDVPLQHASREVLKRMNRSGDPRSLAAQMKHIRDTVPGVSLRTTFISGFPHESEEEFEELCDFISEVKFNNLGVFPYSREEGTPAARMHGQIDEQTKQDRADRIMQLQLRLLEEINKEYVGKEYLDNSPLENGSESLRFWESRMLESDKLDIRLTYAISPPVSLAGFRRFRMSNRYFVHLWNGYEIPKQRAETEVVYMAENGRVCHKDRKCTHLLLSIRRVFREELDRERNQWGSRYVPCEKCATGQLPECFYVTREGHCFHYREDCPGLKRTVLTLTPEEVQGYPYCSRCGGE